MNIFVLDKNPIKAAMLQCDKHIVKMCIEVAQLLSTAHRMLDGESFVDTSSGRKVKRWKLSNPTMDDVLYKATHANHPSAVWARESVQNYIWLYDHFQSLSLEYEFRYGKRHLTWTKLEEPLSFTPRSIPDIGLTPFKLAMPDEFRSDDAVASYRNYYQSKQTKFKMEWKDRQVPNWFKKV